jgi:hypothetical protein
MSTNIRASRENLIKVAEAACNYKHPLSLWSECGDYFTPMPNKLCRRLLGNTKPGVRL